MNYTIGGKDLMSDKKYYKRPSALVNLKSHITRYVRELLYDDHMIGYTDITAQVIENISEELFVDVCRINDQANCITTIDLGDGVLSNSHRTFFYKKNKYNLNLLGEQIKIKVWYGAPAKIARENFLIASEKYPDYHSEYHIATIERNMYRIEAYKLIRGLTLDDVIKKEQSGVWYGIDKNELSDTIEAQVHILKHKNKEASLMKSATELFYNFVTGRIHSTRYGKNVYYPNDCNPGNFVINYDSDKDSYPFNVVNIDYDHMIITNPKQMIHNVAWQFYSRFFDTENLPDDIVVDEFAEWRNKNDLFDLVEKFKSRYLNEVSIYYNSDESCFEYDVTKSTLNGSEFLLDYVNDLKKEKIKETKNNLPKFTNDGLEIVEDVKEDVADLE